MAGKAAVRLAVLMSVLDDDLGESDVEDNNNRGEK